jgi:hypothetical protein
MSDLKTKPTNQAVSDYLATVTDASRLADIQQLVSMMQEISHETPTMWGSSIIGFGSFHYKYASGHEGTTMKMGLSSRKDYIVLYGVIFYDHNTALLEKLGKHKQGKGCLYIKKLADVRLDVLKEMMVKAYSQPAPAEV